MATLKYDKRSAWASRNPVLLAGEVGIELDTLYEKIGNGIDPWSKLHYFGNPGYWGEFADASDQAASANTPTEITFNHSVATENDGVRLENNSRLLVEYPGIYLFSFVLHLENDDTQIHDAHFWLRKNNSASAGNIPLTTLAVSVLEKHGGVPGRAVASLDHTLNLAANDYIELIWAPSSTEVTLKAEPAITSPYSRPTAPSAVCNVSQISAA
jgi:hypothetical protein